MSALSPVATRRTLWALPYAAAFTALFWPTMRWMAERFDAHDSFYSHGWLIPFASAWLIWQRREELAKMKLSPSYAGLALLIPSALIHVVANWWSLNFVSGFAMLGVVWGLVWTAYGRQVLWALRFPMLFLLFMVPLPGVLLIAWSFKMKMWAATMATAILNFSGMPAEQAGSMIRVPGVSVIVDDTCSGLRSLISLIALSVLWTAIMPRGATPWKKLVLVAASIPIALATNMVRILVLVLLTAIYGTVVADSFIHYGSGFVVFGLAIVMLAWLSNQLAPREPA